MNTTEFVAALATLSSVIMLTRGSSSGWVLGVIGSLLYCVVFFEQKLYANLFLQLIFVIQGLYGVHKWDKDLKEEKNVSGKKLDFITFSVLIFLTLGFSVIIGFPLSLLFDLKNSILDIILSIFSILATIMMTQKYVQSWFMWMIIDIGYIYLFIKTDMPISAVLYFFLFLFCISGYAKWNKSKTLFKK